MKKITQTSASKGPASQWANVLVSVYSFFSFYSPWASNTLDMIGPYRIKILWRMDQPVYKQAWKAGRCWWLAVFFNCSTITNELEFSCVEFNLWSTRAASRLGMLIDRGCVNPVSSSL
jgi:hypothetical protein